MFLSPVLHVVGVFLCILAMAMVPPGLVDIVLGDPGSEAFFGSALISLFLGGALIFSTQQRNFSLNLRQMFMLTVLSWLSVALVAALPFLLHHIDIGVADAFFETISGLTTTGSTVLTKLEKLPASILVWRSALQWLGGIGIIVMAIVALPMLRVGGMQLLHMESSDRSEKAFTSTADMARAVVAYYLLITVLCVAAYYAAGMTGFDAVLHALTTVSTAGYSTHDASFAYFTRPEIHWTAIVFMLLGATPFMLFVAALRGRFTSLWRSPELRLFAVIILGCILAIWLWLVLTRHLDAEVAARLAAFNVVSVITTTGFVNADYSLWGGLPTLIFFLLLMVGGCTGSTAGGIKMMRLLVMWAFVRAFILRQIQPRRVVATRLGREPIDDAVGSSVLAFVSLYVMTFLVASLAMTAMGLDFLTATSAAAQAVGNVGPGLGASVGPAGNFGGLPDSAKWLLSLLMLLGRLELVTVVALLTPAFWRDLR